MSNNPYESPQTVESIPKQLSSNKRIPTSKEVLGVALFSVVFLVFSALMLDGGRLLLVAVISVPVMWLMLGIRWLRFRKNT
jgi:hypothetical protein